MIEEVKSQLEPVLEKWQGADSIESIAAITPDASLRRYYRLSLKRGPRKAVAMVFDSVSAAEVGGDGPAVSSDSSYVELTKFLAKNGIPVPELYFDAREDSVLLIEDLGEFLLCHSLIGSQARAYSAEAVDELYRGAVELISRIQKIPTEKDFFPYQRSFTRELFDKEINEFREFVFLPQRPSVEQIEALEQCFKLLLDELDKLPVALAHRDYHSWNLLVDSEQKVRVIDFQDACMAPSMYDLIALLHDRDTDALLGEERRERLYNYFCEMQSLDPVAARRDYLLTLLQRDFKVAGRFKKLAKLRGLTNYEVWVPGTLRRIVSGTAELGNLVEGGEAFSLFNEVAAEMFKEDPSDV